MMTCPLKNLRGLVSRLDQDNRLRVHFEFA